MRLHDARLTGTMSAIMLAAALAGSPAAMARTPDLGEHRPSQQECTPPPLPGKVVDVTVSDQPSGGKRMTLSVKPDQVPAGTVSLRVYNKGPDLAHEAVVLPLPSGQAAGKRAVDSQGRADETGALGEAARNCGAGEGAGIAPGSVGWTTVTLRPGRYEIICNFPSHYGAGMFAELDATGQ
ncbi:hypothetical protein [Nonomuraea cavernae]|uniref:hypothetical protein n=1 Tax=Nonomuraea cavernae TaxID=2045107 RepID=UPI00340E66E6